MSEQGIPKGYQTITPYISVKGARGFLNFLKKAFQAEEVEVSAGEDGTIYNAEVRIGTSMLFAADCRDMQPRPCTIYMYVTDPDALYASALAAGAKSIAPMTDQFYGDRVGAVEDTWGVQWWIAKRVKQVAPEEIARMKDEKRK